MRPARLPPLLVLTDRRMSAARGRDLPATVARAVEGGARAVVLREKDLTAPERAALAAQLRAVLAPVDGLLIAASDAGLGADGVHLAQADPPVLGPGLVGRSCHDGAGLARAADEGCAYATLSPIFPTASKPGYGPALGLAGLARLVQGAGLPVYALGGVQPANAGACRDAGAGGVAVMGTVMSAHDPAAACADLLAAWRAPDLIPTHAPSMHEENP